MDGKPENNSLKINKLVGKYTAIWTVVDWNEKLNKRITTLKCGIHIRRKYFISKVSEK